MLVTQRSECVIIVRGQRINALRNLPTMTRENTSHFICWLMKILSNFPTDPIKRSHPF